jgi:PAS domain S-box-containing protein
VTLAALASVAQQMMPIDADLTERRERIVEARYRVLIEQIPAVTFFASLASSENEIFVSPQIESILGFTQEEWISDPVLWYRQTHPGDRERVSTRFAALCATGEPFRDVVRMISRDGEVVWVHAEARLVRDEAGKVLFLQGVGFDVTDQYRAQEAREQLIREQVARAEAERAREAVEGALGLRDEFLSIASHELQSPIAALDWEVQLARRRILRPAEIGRADVTEALAAIESQASRLRRLVGRLLDITRLEAGKLTIEREPADLAGLVEELVDPVRASTQRHTLFISAPTSLQAEIDPLRIGQVVSNLLTNAVKYSPEGAIEVGVMAVNAEMAEVSVRDHGPGIPADKREHIFERFYQAHSNGQRGGLGLGLYICRQLVEMHGGEIWAEFPADGGTRMVVRLPLHAAPPGPAASAATDVLK